MRKYGILREAQRNRYNVRLLIATQRLGTRAL
jgi:hypothetical protein